MNKEKKLINEATKKISRIAFGLDVTKLMKGYKKLVTEDYWKVNKSFNWWKDDKKEEEE